jgi:hypothetical protein
MHCNQHLTPKFKNTKSFFAKKKKLLKIYSVIVLNINKPMTFARFEIQHHRFRPRYLQTLSKSAATLAMRKISSLLLNIFYEWATFYD